MSGALYGVGLGPGDPELVTVKAARLIANAHVVAYHCARHGRSIARAIAEPYLSGGQIEEQLVYPATTEAPTHPGGYAAAMERFYEQSAARLAAHLDHGRDVVLLAEGDPLFFSSYMHMHKRLTARFDAVIVPGITSVAAAAAAARTPLVEGNEVLTVLPGTLPADRLAAELRRSDAVAIMKLGRSFGTVRSALESAGRSGEAIYVERASQSAERVLDPASVDPHEVPYMSLVLVPGRQAAGSLRHHRVTADPAATMAAGPADAAPAPDRGELVVVGLGPGPRDWLTPEAQAELAAAEHVVGYHTYLERVPVNPRQHRHASDNRVETERAEFALALAGGGHRVAVVSSGDPGVFAMAAAVYEVAARDEFADIPVRVVPGLTAAQAVASRVGAPLGHDFCSISLSDRLKPWSVVLARLDAAARADFAIAIYNPAARASGRNRIDEMREALLRHRDPLTPVVIGQAVGRPDEEVRVVPLAELEAEQIDMQTLLIIGSSQTRTAAGGEGVRVYTPRSYPVPAGG